MTAPEIVEALRRATQQALELGHRLGRAGTSLSAGTAGGRTAYQDAQGYAEILVLPVVEQCAAARERAAREAAPASGGMPT